MVILNVKEKRTVEYKIREINLSNDKLTILCQRDNNDYNEIVQVPIRDAFVNYSSFIKEPVMKLKEFVVVGRQRIYLLGVEFEPYPFAYPFTIAYLDVPNNYKKILNKSITF